MQTKKQSLIESLTNVAIGYGISLLSLFIIFPILGIESSTGKNFLITGYFTVLSITRSYVIRRFFNKKKTASTLETKLEFCFNCEIDTPVKLKNGSYRCDNCGLRY